jgi:hypothetical protein
MLWLDGMMMMMTVQNLVTNKRMQNQLLQTFEATASPSGPLQSTIPT